jgi:hypothetical protein
MADDQKKIVPIDYTHREFQTIREDLIEVAERLYPDSFRDFSDGSFGAMMVDAVAYVADQLNFYLDYNVNEAFLDTAYQYDNIVRHGRALGYKDRGRPSTFGVLSMYILVPASATGIGPDSRYLPILKRGTRFGSSTGLSFVLTDNVDFAAPQNAIVAARTNSITGAPTYYAVKAYGTVVSGYFTREQISVGAFERFKKVGISNPNLSEIISVTDADGNEYYEVEYLAQDMIFKEVANVNFKNDNVPSILKPYLVSRKFVVERGRTSTTIQFGSGKAAATNVIADPGAVAMDLFGKDYVTDTTFDPTRLSENESYGIVPSNTTLNVVYRVTNPANSNVAAGNLNEVGNSIFEFNNPQTLDSGLLTEVKQSLEVSNEDPIVGNVEESTSDEIKRKVFDTFPTQNRAVTQADYENLTYRMPSKFGAVKRCSVQRDPDARKRNLNMYVVSVDSFGFLTACSTVIKRNLKTWLNQHRMINDTIDILDAYIINFGIDFVVKPKTGVDKYDLLDACTTALAAKFEVRSYIGEPLSVADLYAELGKVSGVLEVSQVVITNKAGANYSAVKFDINENTAPDGTYIIVPKNAIVELKYPTTDIRGKVR